MTPDTADARLSLFDHRHGWQLGIFAVASTVFFDAVGIVARLARLSCALRGADAVGPLPRPS